MKCLCCSKEIKDDASYDERNSGWHERCVKKFFGTKKLPELDVSEDELKELVKKTVDSGMTVPGVQKKISLHLPYDNNTRLTITDYPSGYILKPQTNEYESLPEYEDLAMRLAEATGIKTVPHALIKTGGTYSYITKRIDRRFDGDVFGVYAMEDFCQLSERLTFDKYKGSYEKCAKIIDRYSRTKRLDISELFMRIVFSFIIGNSDMHLKNFSLIESEPALREFSLSPAYDLLPVNVILPEDKDETALSINGKKRNLARNDFLIFAKSCDIDEKAAAKMIDKLCGLKEKYITLCQESFLSTELKEKVVELIEGRIKRCGAK